MSETIYFVLQPGSWTGQPDHVCRPLIGTRGGDNIPWVSVARSSGYKQFELVKRDDPAAFDVVAQATAHSAAAAPTWNVVAQGGFLFWKRPTMVRPINAAAAGVRPNPMDDLSSELLLSPAAIAAASAQLRSTDLIAAIPKRGWLVLSAGKPGEFPKMQAVHQVADGVFGRAEPADALTDTVFFVNGNGLAGISKLSATGGSLSLMTADDNAWSY